jgi:mRNA interferase MazF
MGRFMSGDVVVVPFPYSDLTGSKRRPALVLAALKGDDVILCQITSRARMDSYAISLESTDFVNGGLTVSSVIRPNKIFTADSNIILYTAGKIADSKRQEVIDLFVNSITQNTSN